MSDKPMIESPISAEELLAQKDSMIKDLRDKLADFEMEKAIKQASQTVRRRSSAFRNSIKAEDSDVEIDSDEDSAEEDHFKAGEVGGEGWACLFQGFSPSIPSSLVPHATPLSDPSTEPPSLSPRLRACPQSRAGKTSTHNSTTHSLA